MILITILRRCIHEKPDKVYAEEATGFNFRSASTVRDAVE